MQIVGKKGGKGGGGGRTPVEAPDSLRSRSYAKFIDVISCGEIEGPVNGLQSVYFGDVPLQDENGKFNFNNVAIEWRPGSVRQAPSEICETNEVTTDVNTEIKKNNPITRSIIAPEADIVRVTINVPGLSYQNKSNGDINGTTVELRVEYQANGSQWIDAGKIVISGKTTTSYNREHSFRLVAALDTVLSDLAEQLNVVSPEWIAPTYLCASLPQYDGKLDWHYNEVYGFW
ncbi:hypothetical protein ACMXY9_09065 [Pasteurella multocida]